MQPKLLILTSRFPYPLEKGDKLRLYHQIKHLHHYFTISLVCLSEGEVNDGDRNELSPFCNDIYSFNIGAPNNIVSGLTSLFSGKPIQVCHFFNKKIREAIRKLIIKENPDIIYAQLVRMMPYLSEIRRIPRVLDIMDAMSLNMLNEAKKRFFPMSWVYNREARLLSELEKKAVKQFDYLTIISERDRDMISGNHSKLVVVPNGVSTDYFNPEIESEKEYDIGFIGNMGYLPNVNAAIFLIEKVIKPYFPELKVLIAGARPDSRVKALESNKVHVTGWIEDIRVAYASCTLFVAPLFTGAGLQNKILEAMAMKVPCITTSHVNNGCKAQPNQELLIADTADEFAMSIKNLLKNKEKRDSLALKGRKFVEQSYQWSVQVDKLIKVLNKELNGK